MAGGKPALEEQRLILLLLLVLGVLAKNALIVVSAGVLLLLQHLRLQALLPILERRAMELGLILLLIAVLAPFAAGKVGWPDIRRALSSTPGLAAVAGGILAAVLSGRGVELLELQPEVIVGLVVGSILGVLVFGGIPVGPLAAAGFAALLLQFLR